MPIEYKRNIPSVSLASYRHLWRGVPKIGKTTMFRDVMVEKYGTPDAGMLIAVGKELGYKAIANIQAIHASDWGEFKEYVEELVKDKPTNGVQFIGIDTIDELVDIATDKVLNLHLIKNGTKAETINSALGGWGAGQRKVAQLIREQIYLLEDAGYALIFIGHTKVKDIQDKASEVTYQQVTGSLESRYDNIFTNAVDVIATMYLEKTVDDGKLTSTKRWIYFRENSVVDAGSRIENIPERIEMDAKQYVSAIEQGAYEALKEAGVEGSLKEVQKKEEKAREKEVEKYVEKAQKEEVEENERLFGDLNTLEEYHDKISSLVASLDSGMKRQARYEAKEQDIDITKYRDIEDISILQQILKIISNM